MSEIEKRKVKSGREGHGKICTALTFTLLKLEGYFSPEMRIELIFSHRKVYNLLIKLPIMALKPKQNVYMYDC